MPLYFNGNEIKDLYFGENNELREIFKQFTFDKEQEF